MIKLLLDVLSRPRGEKANHQALASERTEGPLLEYCHVDARFSDGIAEIGRLQVRKLFLVFRYVWQAWWMRWRHGADCFYFMPANAARVPIYRDWIVLGLCRPLFRRTVFHWQAMGLGEWLRREAKPWERWISQRIYGRPDLSIVLRDSNRGDAEAVRSLRTVVIPNALEDPCPDFADTLLPRHRARQRIRQCLWAGADPDREDEVAAGESPRVYRILYIGLCHREKGLFDAMEGMRMAGERLPRAKVDASPAFRLHLTVAGSFWSEEDRHQFDEWSRRAAYSKDGPSSVEYVGYAGGEDKWRLFRESDCLVFPTYYSAESFGIVLAEGMAFGLALIASRWRGLHDLLPEGYPGAVDPRCPEQIASTILSHSSRDYDASVRERFLQEYSLPVFARRMKACLSETCA